MTTPTDDEIVARMRAMGLVTGDATKAAAYAALHLAREGLPVPVKEEAETLWGMAYSAYNDYCRKDDAIRAADGAFRTFLAERDAERDADMDELRKALERARGLNCIGAPLERDEAVAELVESAKLLKASWPTHSDICGLTAALDEANARAKRMREALESVMVGGNHLALLIGADHPSFEDDYDTARAHYDGGDQFEAWCCWRSIMQARRALATLPDSDKRAAALSDLAALDGESI
jgi:hypothetical protein